ncbi:MAG: hypothetical protein BMS9Abin36_0628 [Gammaproteobacteria bacterium]|nr:MAG: hypothetical protein BMS9Abin36_0628 [Gammaproteobacteria bacterium]
MLAAVTGGHGYLNRKRGPCVYPEFAENLPSDWQSFDRFFAAMADPTRQKILLVFDCDEEICVNDIARLFQLSRPAISHHLKVLRNAGILTCNKRGREVYYRVDHKRFADVMKIVYNYVSCPVDNKPAMPLSRTA